MSSKTSDQPGGRSAYFAELYAESDDPWEYHRCDYEIAKRADTIAALPYERYSRACEIGCSIGVLTRDLAPRCDALIGIDIAEAAVAKAREATADLPHVSIEVRHVPYQLPDGDFDLLMLSEVLYFLNRKELYAMASFAVDRVRPRGTVMIVSYDGETLTELNGHAATEIFLSAATGFSTINETVRPHYHRVTLRRDG